MSYFFSDSIEFSTFGVQHFITLISFVLMSVITTSWLNQKPAEFKLKFFQYSCWFVFIGYTSLLLLLYSLEGVQPSENLPLYLCNFAGLAMPFFAHKLNQSFFDIFYFWIIGGTLQAVITPDLRSGFPSFYFFKYWILHLGLIFVIILAVVNLNFKPRFKGIWLSWLALELYFIFMLIINNFLGSNYLYINRKPENPSLLDYFGEWPMYVLVVQIIVIPVFIILYLPFHKWKKGHIS
jgi:hypothetical integral membrane protein (TIGR02206 family)